RARRPAVRLALRRGERDEHAVQVVASDAAVVDRVLGGFETEAHGARARELPEARQADARDGGAVAEPARVRHLQRERRGADDLPLAGLGLGPHVAIDDLVTVLLAHRRDDTLAGHDVARPRELREARAELPYVRDAAAGAMQELAQIAHRQHAVRENAGVARVL